MISSSFCQAVFKINGTTGDVIWKLGGINSTFDLGSNATFHYEHDARWIIENEKLSLFDNGGMFDGKKQT
jgi:hypothetical protein